MKKPSFKNILFFVIIIALFIPQIRQPIQVFMQKGLALFGPSIKNEDNRAVITDYNWKMKQLDGSDYNFNTAKNKVVLVNFWATWCPPCIAEMPSLQKLYNDYNTSVEFVIVSNENLEVMQSFLDKNNYSFNTLKTLESPTSTQFNVTSIPRTFLISKSGEIVIDKTGAANWNSEDVRKTIDKLLAL